jgi:membrane-associated phospholipid phosphatase
MPHTLGETMNETLSLPYRMALLLLTLAGWLGIYFFVNRRQVQAGRHIDLGMALDRKIPYLPNFALVYFSTYIFVIQPFFILAQARQFYWMLASFASISILASLIHAILPSKIERVEQVSAGGVSGWGLALFQKTCKPYGNFPSMHVGLSVPVVAANFLVGGPLAGSIALVWALLIALSTLFTKQHYILDVLAGAAVGSVVFALAFWWMLAQ